MFFAIFCTFVFTPSFFNLPKLPSFSYWLECWGTSSKPLPTVGVFANFFSRVRSQETEILISPPHRARGRVVSPLVTTKEDEKNWHEPNFFLHWCIAKTLITLVDQGIINFGQIQDSFIPKWESRQWKTSKIFSRHPISAGSGSRK